MAEYEEARDALYAAITAEVAKLRAFEDPSLLFTEELERLAQAYSLVRGD